MNSRPFFAGSGLLEKNALSGSHIKVWGSRFLKISIIPNLLFLFIICFIELYESNNIKTALRNQQPGTKQYFSNILSENIRDILTLHQSLLIQTTSGDNFQIDGQLDKIEHILFARAIYSCRYDQFRLLDATGMERIRINQTDQGPVLVPKEQLQDKSNRPYFQKGMELAKNQFYISKINLNMEQGKIEVPHKLVMRIILPIYSLNGMKTYLLITNIRVNNLFDELRLIHPASDTILQVIDSNGYYLHSPAEGATFGWQIPARARFNLQKQAPDLWKKINDKPTGITRKGMTYYSWIQLDLSRELMEEFLDYCQNNKPQNVPYFRTIVGAENSSPLFLVTKTKPRIIFSNPQALASCIVLFLLLQIIMMVLVKRNYEIETLTRLNRENLEKLAFRDPLTCLNNRRGFQRYFNRETQRSKKGEDMPGLLLVDIDHFKRINDTYGHDVGDLVLQSLAKIFNQCLRITDQAARHGGEEFSILLPETDLENSVMTAERIRTACEKKLGSCSNLKETITVSIGVTRVEKNQSLDESFKVADRRLYAAKESGRNRVVATDPDT